MNGPIFIVGNSRSGTTMLGRVFGNHSAIYTFNELHFFEQQIDSRSVIERPIWSREKLVSMLERLITSARDSLFDDVVQGKYANEADDILVQSGTSDPVAVYQMFLNYEARNHGKTIPCEQTPRYIFFVSEILHAFPDAKIINMVRDPRDVLLSQKNKWRRRFLGARNIPLREALRAWVNYHPYTIAKLWVAAVRTSKNFRDEKRFASIRFEDLVTHPDKTVRKLCEFVGVPFEGAMLDVPQIGSSTGKDRPDAKGIDAGRSGSWRKGGLTDVELVICERVATEEMLELGYQIDARTVSFLKRMLSMSIFFVKISLALLLNLRRTRNLLETLRRRLVSAR